MYRHLLVPLDESDLAVELVSQALALAKPLQARVTFFHARPDLAATGEGALRYAMDPKSFANAAVGHARGVLAKAEVSARAAGVAYDAVAVTSDRPFEAILETADARNCDLIVMASHGRRGLRGLVLGSQTHKVLQHTRVPVLVCTVEGNATGRQMRAALGMVKDEHRSLAAVIDGLRFLVREAREKGTLADMALLQAGLHYIRSFPERLHHPKEEDWIFRRLRNKDRKLDETLDVLEQQHRDGATAFAELEAALEQYRDSGDGDGLGAALDRFAELEWEHMNIEEAVVFPAAQHYLAESDWGEIAAAFEGNLDPRFSEEADGDYRELFSRILNLMAGLENATGED